MPRERPKKWQKKKKRKASFFSVFLKHLIDQILTPPSILHNHPSVSFQMFNLTMPLTDTSLSADKKPDIGLFNSTSLPWFRMSYKWGALKRNNDGSFLRDSNLIGLGQGPVTGVFFCFVFLKLLR